MGTSTLHLEPVRFPKTRQGIRNLDQMKGPLVPVSGGPVPACARVANIADAERSLSIVGGGGLIGAALASPSLGGLLLGIVGGALVYRGVTGHCDVYQALGMNTADASKAPQEMAYRPR